MSMQDETAVGSTMPDDLTFVQEWRRIMFYPSGERIDDLDSGWFREKTVAESLLNDEYPNPNFSGFRYMLQTRWVSETRTDEPESDYFRGR
jgi:hypothetical protein